MHARSLPSTRSAAQMPGDPPGSVDQEHRGADDAIGGEVGQRLVGVVERVRPVVSTRSGTAAASARNSSPSRRVLAVTLRSWRSWNRWSLVLAAPGRR